MKILVLDGFTLNPGDLSWEKLQNLASCDIYDRTPPEKIIERAKDADIILTNKISLSRSLIEQLPNLKYIGILATGVNVVDIEAAKEKGIIVTNIPSYSTPSVAQMVFSHLLNLCLHVAEHSNEAKAGKWSKSVDFCYWDYPLIELEGLTFGIIGTGKIGQATAKLAMAFGMQVLAYNVRRPETLLDGIKMVSLKELLQESDVVSLHCPLNNETEKIINSAHLGLMKPSAFLINTGRGGLIDEPALAKALDADKIAGAGLDVLSSEPPKSDNPLLYAKNCYITPHIAWATKKSRARLMQIAVDNVKAFLIGKPVNVVA